MKATELGPPQLRAWALLGVVMVTFLVAMEGTVVSTSMPKIVQDLGGEKQMSWAFSAYWAALAITGPLWGYLADRWGARPAYLGSISLFLLGSGWAALVGSMPELIAARFLQGLGGGGLTPLGQLILSLMYDRVERARSQAWLVLAFAIASIFGPLIGGYLSEYWSWRWVFSLSLPFAGLGGLLIRWCLKLPPVEVGSQRFDFRGFLLFVIWMLTMLSFVDSGSPWLGTLVALVGWALLRHSKTQSHPFVPVQLASLEVFSGAAWLALLIGAGVFGLLSYLPLFLQQSFHLDSVQAGQAMLPLMLTWTWSSAVGPRQALKVGYAPVLAVSVLGLVLAFLGFCLSSHQVVVFLSQVALGIAGGFSFSPLTLAVQEVVPRQQLGQATSAIVFLRSLGATLGMAILGSLLHHRGFPALFWAGLVGALLACLAWLPFRRAIIGAGERATLPP